MRYLYVVFIVMWLPLIGFGQWQWMQTIGGSGIDNSGGMVAASDNVYVSGIFSGDASAGNFPLTSVGGHDVFLAALTPEGVFSWVISGGGPLDDEVTAMAVDATGNVLVAGAYWLSAMFDSIALEAEQSSRSLFLLNISPQGALRWAKNLHGTAIKKIGAVGADAAGNIYIAGYFQGQLSLDEWTLEASGATDFFVAKLNADGVVTWAAHAGQTGDTRITGMAVYPGGGVVVGGYFNALTQIGDYQFTANTYDRDVFLASYDVNGDLQWARKAGGVHNDELTGIAMDATGAIYATGYLVGVMSLGEGIAIQSANGNPDFYMLKYNSEGLPLQARAMGGTLRDQSMAIVIEENGVTITGFFQAPMSIDGQLLDNNGQTAGFILRFSESLGLVQAQTIRAINGPVYAGQLTRNQTGDMLVSGSYEGALQYGDATLPAVGNADAFIGKWTPLVTSTTAPADSSSLLKVFPNPASNQFEISADLPLQLIRIIDQQGKTCYSATDTTPVQTSSWPAGAYRILAHTRDGRLLETGIVIQH